VLGVAGIGFARVGGEQDAVILDQMVAACALVTARAIPSFVTAADRSVTEQPAQTSVTDILHAGSDGQAVAVDSFEALGASLTASASPTFFTTATRALTVSLTDPAETLQRATALEGRGRLGLAACEGQGEQESKQRCVGEVPHGERLRG
jgi:uncharacterized membrane-anchored protein